MKLRRTMAGLLALSTVLTMTACNTETKENDTTTTTAAPAADGGAADTTAAPSDDTASGEKLTLKVLTHRTDRIEDGSLDAMTDAFEAANNCVVEYQGFTDYSTDIPTMMNTTEYGDVLMIPDTVKVEDLANFFEPLGSLII